MRVLGIDPDSRGSGWAIVEGDPPRVLKAGIIDTRGNTGILAVEKQILKIREVMPDLPEVDHIIAEYPQSYQDPRKAGRPMHVDPNHLIMIAAISGAVVAAGALKEGGTISLVRPAVWKGQRSKGAVHRYACRIVKWRYGVTSKPSLPLTEVIPHEDTEMVMWEGKACKPWSEVLDAVGLALFELKKQHP